MAALWERILDAGPIVGFVVLALVGAVREWWVWGHVFRAERREKEFWRDKALALMGLAEQSVEVSADLLIEDPTT